MLDAGWSTLEYLKSRLLPQEAEPDEPAEWNWDAALQALGKAVANRLNRHCGRVFERGSVTDEFEALASAWVTTRYPVETIDSLAVVAPDSSTRILTGYRALMGAGVIELPSVAGGALDRLAITYTGGYWLDPLDGTELPDGATALPDDLLEAWVIQCQAQAETRGLLEAVAIRSPRKGEEKELTAGIQLVTDVKQALEPYRRFGGA